MVLVLLCTSQHQECVLDKNCWLRALRHAIWCISANCLQRTLQALAFERPQVQSFSEVLGARLKLL
jgi:hypothetical protein